MWLTQSKMTLFETRSFLQGGIIAISWLSWDAVYCYVNDSAIEISVLSFTIDPSTFTSPLTSDVCTFDDAQIICHSNLLLKLNE